MHNHKKMCQTDTNFKKKHKDYLLFPSITKSAVFWCSAPQDYWRFRGTNRHPHHGPGWLQHIRHIHTSKTQWIILCVFAFYITFTIMYNTDLHCCTLLCFCPLCRNWAYHQVSLWRVPISAAGSLVLWAATVNSPSGWCSPAVCPPCWFSSSSSWRRRSPRE